MRPWTVAVGAAVQVTVTGSGFDALDTVISVVIGGQVKALDAVEIVSDERILIDLSSFGVDQVGYATVIVVRGDGMVANLEQGFYVASVCPEVGTVADDDGECVACPEGTVCPGGDRVWPTEGYWSPDVRGRACVPWGGPVLFALSFFFFFSLG